MSKRTLNGSLALTKLVHVKMTKKGKSGMVEGLFIPIDANFLERDENGNVYLPVRTIVNETADEYKNHGFIAKSIGSGIWKAATDEKKEMFKEKQSEITPILGSIRDFSNSGSANDGSGAASEETFDENDDLPF